MRPTRLVTSAGSTVSTSEKLVHAAPLRERVRERLEQLIIDGTYRPGQHLVETELANRLGVSRGPIREALHELKLRKWVEMRPRQGSFVHVPTAEEVDQFFHVRTLLETEAASLVAGRMTPEVEAVMRQTIFEAREAMAAGDERQLVRANTVFHGYIHRLAGNAVLEELIEQLDRRLQWYFAPFVMERAIQAWDEHEALLAALVENDRRRAARIMRKHTEAARVAFVHGHEMQEADGRSA